MKWTFDFTAPADSYERFIRNQYVYDGQDVVLDLRSAASEWRIALGMTEEEYYADPWSNAAISGLHDTVSRHWWAPHDRPGETSLLISSEATHAGQRWTEAATGIPIDITTAPDEVLWLLGDNLNSVRDVVRMTPVVTEGVTNWVGVREEHLSYDSYGKVLQSVYYAYDNVLNSHAGQQLLTDGTTGNDLRYLYTSQEYNVGTGTLNFGGREYDPDTARFLQIDPIEEVSGQWNWYIYVGNSPIIFTDPTGLHYAENTPVYGPEAPPKYLFTPTYYYFPSFGVTRIVKQYIHTVDNPKLLMPDNIRRSVGALCGREESPSSPERLVYIPFQDNSSHGVDTVPQIRPLPKPGTEEYRIYLHVNANRIHNRWWGDAKTGYVNIPDNEKKFKEEYEDDLMKYYGERPSYQYALAAEGILAIYGLHAIAAIQGGIRGPMPEHRPRITIIGENYPDTGQTCPPRVATQEHHSDPKFMGGDPKQPTTTMPKDQHQQLHRELNEYLRTKTDAAGNHMRPQRGNSGANIQRNFPRSERLDAMAEFYRNNHNRYPDAARDFFNQHPELR